MPVAVATLPYAFVAHAIPGILREALSALFNAAGIVLMTAAYAAMASRLFLALADRLARPPGMPTGAAPA